MVSYSGVHAEPEAGRVATTRTLVGEPEPPTSSVPIKARSPWNRAASTRTTLAGGAPAACATHATRTATGTVRLSFPPAVASAGEGRGAGVDEARLDALCTARACNPAGE